MRGEIFILNIGGSTSERRYFTVVDYKINLFFWYYIGLLLIKPLSIVKIRKHRSPIYYIRNVSLKF